MDRNTEYLCQKAHSPPKKYSVFRPPLGIALRKKQHFSIQPRNIRKISTKNLKSKNLGEPGTFHEPPSKPPRFLFLSHFEYDKRSNPFKSLQEVLERFQVPRVFQRFSVDILYIWSLLWIPDKTISGASSLRNLEIKFQKKCY